LPGKYGLGIHYTLDISGAVKFGPDAMLTDSLDYTFSPGVKEKFNKAISEYWQEISAYELYEDYVGIRPKIQEPKIPFQDFSVLDHKHHGIKKMIFLQGIESPGLTCCISLAKYLVQQLDS
jgi:L-2-hydroxyglutarate oxidase LhgO